MQNSSVERPLWPECEWQAWYPNQAPTQYLVCRQQGDAFVYADNSESVRFDFRLKSAAIVFHDHQQLVVAILEHHTDARRMCMLENIGERFLNDAENSRFNRRRESKLIQATMKIKRDRVSL